MSAVMAPLPTQPRVVGDIERRRRIGDPQLTEHDLEELSTRIARKTVDSMWGKLTDDKSVDQIMTIWSKHLDQHLGKTLRRAIGLFLVGLGLVVALKMEAILAWLKSN